MRPLSARLLRTPIRSLHVSRPALKGGAVAESDTFKKISKNNVHVLEAATLRTWQEIPVGGIHGTANRPDAVMSIWYNHAVVPLYAVSAVAAGLCCWFLYR
jgi:hypothetical protein